MKAQPFHWCIYTNNPKSGYNEIQYGYSEMLNEDELKEFLKGEMKRDPFIRSVGVYDKDKKFLFTVRP